MNTYIAKVSSRLYQVVKVLLIAANNNINLITIWIQQNTSQKLEVVTLMVLFILMSTVYNFSEVNTLVTMYLILTVTLLFDSFYKKNWLKIITIKVISIFLILYLNGLLLEPSYWLVNRMNPYLNALFFEKNLVNGSFIEYSIFKLYEVITSSCLLLNTFALIENLVIISFQNVLVVLKLFIGLLGYYNFWLRLEMSSFYVTFIRHPGDISFFNNEDVVPNLFIGFNIVDTYPIQFKPLLGEPSYMNPELTKLLFYANQRKYLHIVPLNLNINNYSGLNTHFPSYRSSMVLTLTVWQYWWWMSFIFIILLFNRLLVKFFFQNTLKIEPKTYAGLKANGRWGDVFASLFPIFWCSNILLNSNLILRVIENHSESGMFLLRIRGKQWYWVYKFSVNLKRDISNPGIIIGRGNKLNITYGLGSQPDNIVKPQAQWSKKVQKFVNLNKKIRKTSISCVQPLNLIPQNNLTLGFLNTQNKFIKYLTVYNKLLKHNQIPLKHNKNYITNSKRDLLIFKTYKCHNNRLFVLKHQASHGYRNYNRHYYSIQQQPKSVWRAIKTNQVVHFSSIKSYDLSNVQKIMIRKVKPITVLEKQHFFKKLRMINTYNTLILPTNINITVITNSFDVVHSWFVPGLGLKFDCVPGRSTHYTLRIHKPGVYYGHCAEVCGRFHHHMPVKICALPFHQFNYYYNMYYKL